MKDTELVHILGVLLRWSLLIILIVAITMGALIYTERQAIPMYQAHVTLLLSTPDREDVSATDEYTFTNDRDEITNVADRFTTIAQFDEVKRRTLEELGTATDYMITAETELGTDFVTITVTSDSPELAADIANTHATKAIEFFGEIRALPSGQALMYFDNELLEASQDLADAQAALTNFYTQNGIITLDDEIEIQNSVLEKLEVMRVESLAPSYDPSTDSVRSHDTTTVDGLIDDQRLEIVQLNILLPEYERLKANLEIAQDTYDKLAAKYAETEMRQSFASEAMFLQIIDAADVPTSPTSNRIRTYGLGLAASLGLGILLAFFFDYLLAKR